MWLCVPHVDTYKNNRATAKELLTKGLNCSNPKYIAGNYNFASKSIENGSKVLLIKFESKKFEITYTLIFFRNKVQCLKKVPVAYI